MSTDSPDNLITDPAELSIGIVCASFNSDLCESLLTRVTSCLQEKGMLKKLLIERVPGSNEVPSGIDLILEGTSFDCMIGLGVVIKGSTSHHHLVAEASGHALQNLSVKYHTPIINGIVVTDDLQSAEDRIVGEIDRGKNLHRRHSIWLILKENGPGSSN